MNIRQRLQSLEAALLPAPFQPMAGESIEAATVRAAVARYGLEKLVRQSYSRASA